MGGVPTLLRIPLLVRPLEVEDLPALEWYGHQHGQLTAVRAALADPAKDVAFLVAVANGAAVGRLGIDYSAKGAGGVAVLWSMAVLPELQRLGIGTALLRAARQAVSDRGAPIVEIGVEHENDGARRLYERCGFDLTGEEARGDEGTRVLLMRAPAGGPPSPVRTAVRRKADRGAYDRRTIEAILDEGFVCHLGVMSEHGPVVLPTAYARAGDRLYLHGARANAALRNASDGIDVCVTVTLLDGLVLARSAFHHSMNYRSVVVFGRAEEVTGDADKAAAMDALVEHVIPGRGGHTRAPTASELRSTLVLSLPLTEASAKVRTGPPVDDPEDMDLQLWAGVVPLALTAGPPQDDPELAPGVEAPPHARGWRRPAP